MMTMMCLLSLLGGANGLRFVEKVVGSSSAESQRQSTSLAAEGAADRAEPTSLSIPWKRRLTEWTQNRRNSFSKRASSVDPAGGSPDPLPIPMENCTAEGGEEWQIKECEYWKDQDNCLKKIMGKYMMDDYIPDDLPNEITELYFKGFDAEKAGNTAVYNATGTYSFDDWFSQLNQSTLITGFTNYVSNETWCNETDGMELCSTGPNGAGFLDDEMTEIYNGTNPYNSLSYYCEINGYCNCMAYEIYCEENCSTWAAWEAKAQEVEKNCNADSDCTFMCGGCYSGKELKEMGIGDLCNKAKISQNSELCLRMRNNQKFIAALPQQVAAIIPPVIIFMDNYVPGFRGRGRQMSSKDACASSFVKCVN